MSKAHPPELKKYMDKQIDFHLNGKRYVFIALLVLSSNQLYFSHVSGVLRGFDPFMNIVVDEAVEHLKGGGTNNIGMIVIRGGR